MIKQLSLTYFRKVEQDTMIFADGLNVIRGANEASKSTRLEALAFAMFGTKALRNSLSEVVTWGHKESELRVELDTVNNGRSFKTIRSKAGAEVYVDSDPKPFITGQQAVSEFWADLLGADANTAAQLMLATQGGLRGVLNEGPKGTSALIESLSDLQLIDQIIDKAQNQLQLGSTAVLEERLKTAITTRATIEPPVEPVKPDTEALKAELQRLDLKTVSEAAVKAASDFAAEHNKRTHAEAFNRAIDTAQINIANTITALDAETKATQPMPDVEFAKLELAQAKEWTARAYAYEKFGEIEQPPNESRLEFDRKEKWNADETARQNKLRTEALTSIKIHEAKVSHDDNCPTCGQGIAHLEHVKADRLAIARVLNEQKARVADCDTLLSGLAADAQVFSLVRAADNRIKQAAQKISQYTTIDDDVIPSIVMWSGEPVPSEMPDVGMLETKVMQAQAEINATIKSQGKVETLNAQLVGFKVALKDAGEKLKALDMVSDEAYGALAQASVDADAAKVDVEGRIALLSIQIEVADREYAESMSIYKMAAAQIATLDANILQTQKDIESIQFNNVLLKKIRAARPIIGNKLWSLVLSTVSTLFSQMRGEQSLVTRSKDGFLVNGKSVESLSGSTLDLLGLSIRVALVRTFLPNCGLLVLDEVQAACDIERSASMLGFIASAGFQQVLLVSHEDISESMASNLITL